MKQLRIVSAIVVLLLGSVAVAQYLKRGADDKTYPPRDYVIHQIETRSSPEGSVKSFGYKTSWVKATGEIKTVAVRFKGDTPLVSYGLGNEDGQFSYKAGEGVIHLSTTNDDPARERRRSSRYLLTSPQYSRTESVLAFTAYVMSIQNEGQTSSELYFAPEVGPYPVKTVGFIRNNRKEIVETVVVEPVRIEFSMLAQEMFVTPRLPVDFSEIEQDIAEAEREGKQVAAEKLKGLVANLKKSRGQ